MFHNLNCLSLLSSLDDTAESKSHKSNKIHRDWIVQRPCSVNMINSSMSARKCHTHATCNIVMLELEWKKNMACGESGMCIMCVCVRCRRVSAEHPIMGIRDPQLSCNISVLYMYNTVQIIIWSVPTRTHTHTNRETDTHNSRVSDGWCLAFAVRLAFDARMQNDLFL